MMKRLFLAIIAASMIVGIMLYAGNPTGSEGVAAVSMVGQGIARQSQKMTDASPVVIVRAGENVLHAEWENTELAQEIQSHFPLTVDMTQYGGREYYGSLGWTPIYSGKGKLRFENGDITYCAKNNTLAIFYAQTDHPDLTMEVVRVGRIHAEDLSIMYRFGNQAEFTFAFH